MKWKMLILWQGGSVILHSCCWQWLTHRAHLPWQDTVYIAWLINDLINCSYLKLHIFLRRACELQFVAVPPQTELRSIHFRIHPSEANKSPHLVKWANKRPSEASRAHCGVNSVLTFCLGRCSRHKQPNEEWERTDAVMIMEIHNKQNTFPTIT